MTQVNIQNIGNFQIPNERAEDLKDWLLNNDGIKTKTKEEELKEVINSKYEGLELLND
jgi:hypothetical protein